MQNEIKNTSRNSSKSHVDGNSDNDDEIEYNDISWSLTWTLAFPTLLPTRMFIDTHSDNSNRKTPENITAKDCKTLDNEKENQTTFHHLPIPWCLLAYKEIFGDVLGIDTVQKVVDKQHQYSSTNNCQMQTTVQDNNLGYGEITPKAVMELMAHIQSNGHSLNDTKKFPSSGGTILDLGSGTGRVLFAAALVHHFEYVLGVEIVKDLHDEAIENKKRWESLHPFLDLTNDDPDYRHRHTQFIFRQDDITTYSKPSHISPSDRGTQCMDTSNMSSILSSLHTNHQSFTIILIHATLFDGQLMQHIQEICEDCPKGTFFVTVSKPLIVGDLATGIELLDEREREMTWGFGTVYLQRKL